MHYAGSFTLQGIVDAINAQALKQGLFRPGLLLAHTPPPSCQSMSWLTKLCCCRHPTDAAFDKRKQYLGNGFARMHRVILLDDDNYKTFHISLQNKVHTVFCMHAQSTPG